MSCRTQIRQFPLLSSVAPSTLASSLRLKVSRFLKNSNNKNQPNPFLLKAVYTHCFHFLNPHLLLCPHQRYERKNSVFLDSYSNWFLYICYNSFLDFLILLFLGSSFIPLTVPFSVSLVGSFFPLKVDMIRILSSSPKLHAFGLSHFLLWPQLF